MKPSRGSESRSSTYAAPCRVSDYIYLFTDRASLCPGGAIPCSGNGRCDVRSPKICKCNEGFEGLDCSSMIKDKYIIKTDALHSGHTY